MVLSSGDGVYLVTVGHKKTLFRGFLFIIMGMIIYQTHSPCKDRSKLILQSEIKRLVYINEYKDTTGLDFLKEAGIEIKKYDI